MSVTLQFLGAAETVSGSKFLLAVGKKRFLVDCGMFQGPRKLRELNWRPFPVSPDDIDAVIVTHAHIDHIGLLPRLYQQGYRGRIYCTKATSSISRLSLPDAGRLQEEFARYANKKGFSRHKPALPLYTGKDARRTCKLLHPQPFHELIQLGGGCSFRFRRAGHILGSAFIEFYLPNGEVILFSGDLGRPNMPIVRNPEPVENADYLLIESTYGNRLHRKVKIREQLKDALSHVCETGGMLVVPSFAIGRTQDLLYYLQELEAGSECPEIPVYVDSPMAVDATAIYARHEEDHDLEMTQLRDEGKNPLKSAEVHLVRHVDQSKMLNLRAGPGIIISSSGMASGGRVLHHLAKRLPKPENMVLFVGYQAAGTLGRKLVEGAEVVKIMGRDVQVRAKVHSLLSLSAHADYEEVLAWLSHFKRPPKRTFIVHGEPPAQASLQDKIKDRLGWETEIPTLGETASFG
ncbi:MAG: MBL fold metallo-hydrolase [Armatimonadetes bacterium]|nr:MBL fold metallo-hydrolase [Armatimonadota bacterium]